MLRHVRAVREADDRRRPDDRPPQPGDDQRQIGRPAADRRRLPFDGDVDLRLDFGSGQLGPQERMVDAAQEGPFVEGRQVERRAIGETGLELAHDHPLVS
jgi:hypothetical protein